MSIKLFLLSKKIPRIILFFLFHKKVSRKRIDKKIDGLSKFDSFTTWNGSRIQKNLIVSLTSFPARIDEVQYAVFSMLSQSVLPEKIILWLAYEQFENKEKDLPVRLLAMRGNRFEIRWCRDLRSYKKLISALQDYYDEFRGKNIVICDDDIYYRKHTIRRLYEEHLRHSDDVICHIGKEMQFSPDGKLMPYDNWLWCKSCSSKKTVLPIGGGTVLYPWIVLEKSSLLVKEDLFQKLAPNADDIWFWFSIVSAGFFVSIPKHTYKKMIYTNPEREYGITDGVTLAKINEGESLNDKQLKEIEQYFKKTIKRVVEEKNETSSSN